MMAAARPETISFNKLHKHDNSRVKQVLFRISEDKPVPRSELVKGFRIPTKPEERPSRGRT